MLKILVFAAEINLGSVKAQHNFPNVIQFNLFLCNICVLTEQLNRQSVFVIHFFFPGKLLFLLLVLALPFIIF